MKRYLILLIVLTTAFVVNVSVINAKEENSGITREEYDILKTRIQDRADLREKRSQEIKTTREESKQKMQAFRESIKDEKDTAKAKIKELRIIGRENALQRFDKAIERISDLKDKVNVKIDKLDAKGVDVATAEDFIETTETKLTDAKEKVAEINALLATSLNLLTLDDKTKFRTLAQETQNLIIEAHKALRDAVKSLKDEVKAKLSTSQ